MTSPIVPSASTPWMLPKPRVNPAGSFVIPSQVEGCKSCRPQGMPAPEAIGSSASNSGMVGRGADRSISTSSGTGASSDQGYAIPVWRGKTARRRQSSAVFSRVSGSRNRQSVTLGASSRRAFGPNYHFLRCHDGLRSSWKLSKHIWRERAKNLIS